jgi:hypothetical protein
MAARRLILVMLVLLVLSSAVAALIPIERDALEGSSSTTSTTVQEPPATGELVRRKVDADAKRPPTIRITRGDQLELTVTSSRPGQIEIVALGVLQDVDRFLPARFDVLPADRGTYSVGFIPPEPPGATGRVIARIAVGQVGGGST